MSGWRKKKIIANKYNATSSMYDSLYAEEQELKYKAAMGELQETRIGKILDAGCGTGLFFKHIAPNSEWVVGLDVSRKSLLLAKDRNRCFSNFDVILADADFMPFTSQVFSHVFAFTLLQNMPRPRPTLAELMRSTEEGGSIIVTWLKSIFPKEELLRLLKKPGLSIIRLIDDPMLKCYVTVTSKSTLKTAHFS